MPRANVLLPAWLTLLAFGAPAQAGCAISTTGVNFGAYDPRSPAALDGVGAIEVRCSGDGGRGGNDDNNDGDGGGGNKKLEISAGNSGSYATRRMTAGGNALNYNLYTSPTRATVWGDGRNGTDSVKVRGKDRTVSTNVYGRVPAGQNVRAGTYTDTLIVSIAF